MGCGAEECKDDGGAGEQRSGSAGTRKAWVEGYEEVGGRWISSKAV